MKCYPEKYHSAKTFSFLLLEVEMLRIDSERICLITINEWNRDVYHSDYIPKNVHQ